MKPISEQNQKDLAYTSPLSFLDQLLSDQYFSKGEIKKDISGATFIGEINLNAVTVELERYISAKIAYTVKQDSEK